MKPVDGRAAGLSLSVRVHGEAGFTVGGVVVKSSSIERAAYVYALSGRWVGEVPPPGTSESSVPEDGSEVYVRLPESQRISSQFTWTSL